MNETAPTPSDEFSLSAFLRGLTDEGVSMVSPGVAIPRVDAEAAARLQSLSTSLAQDLPGNPPEFRADAALWAVNILYQVSRFVACRDLGEPEIVKTLAEPCPEPRNPGTDWSVDLSFRLLPEIFRTARHLANADPLVRELRTLAAQWPLSSTGIPDLASLNIESFISHPPLRQLYVDRILETSDVSRVNDPRVLGIIRETLGAHPELHPVMAKHLSDSMTAPAINAS
jgi:hypothetical protein